MKTIANCRIWGAGHRTIARLDGVAREALDDIAGRRGCTVSDLLSEIDHEREGSTFAVATRSYVVAHYRAMMRAAMCGDAGTVAR
jgi:predicted DNA-binding ribbon-helix-helix protein